MVAKIRQVEIEVIMELWKRLTGSFSHRGRALSLYQRGMQWANKHNHSRALDDYSAVIDMSDAPSDLRAMAMYNRALVHAACGDAERAADDLRNVLDGSAAPENVRLAARQKLVRMSRQQRPSGT
jgi:hypothetical protein